MMIWVPPARGDVVRAETTRTSSYVLQVGEGFAGSGGYAQNAWSFSGSSPDPKDEFFVDSLSMPMLMSLRRTQRGATAEGWGDVAVDSFQLDDQQSVPRMTVDWRLAPQTPGVLDGGFWVGYEFDAVDGLPGGGRRFDSFLFRHEQDGEQLMRFSGGGENLVSIGDRFVVDVSMNGRWDPSSQGAGSVRFLSIHESFAIEQFFVYNPATDTTRFRAVSESYSADPLLRFDLVGVPAPFSAFVFLAGGAALGTRRRRSA
jgi:hypothetical protein